MKKTYAYHKPSKKGLDVLKYFRTLFNSMAEEIESFIPDSRERSVALTQLETVDMWVRKAIVLNDPESKVQE